MYHVSCAMRMLYAYQAWLSSIHCFRIVSYHHNRVTTFIVTMMFALG